MQTAKNCRQGQDLLSLWHKAVNSDSPFYLFLFNAHKLPRNKNSAELGSGME